MNIYIYYIYRDVCIWVGWSLLFVVAVFDQAFIGIGVWLRPRRGSGTTPLGIYLYRRTGLDTYAASQICPQGRDVSTGCRSGLTDGVTFACRGTDDPGTRKNEGQRQEAERLKKQKATSRILPFREAIRKCLNSSLAAATLYCKSLAQATSYSLAERNYGVDQL